MTDSATFQVLWKLLHFIAYYLPKNREISREQLNAFIEFFRHFVIFVPCQGCADHAMMYFIINKPALVQCKTGQNVFEWTVDFHNHVNRMYSKPIFSYDQAEQALLAHLSGYSEQQKKVEATLTNEQQELAILRQQIRVLRQDETDEDEEAPVVKLPHFPGAIQYTDTTFQCVWDAVHMIAASQPKNAPLAEDRLKEFRSFLQYLFAVLPHRKLSEDSLQFLKDNEPSFKTQAELFEYTVQWYNKVSGIQPKVSAKKVEDDLRSRLRQELTSQIQIARAKKSAREKISELKKEVQNLVEKKKKKTQETKMEEQNPVLVENPAPAEKKKTKNTFSSMFTASLNNVWIASLISAICAIVILILLIIFFMVLLSRTKAT